MFYGNAQSIVAFAMNILKINKHNTITRTNELSMWYSQIYSILHGMF